MFEVGGNVVDVLGGSVYPAIVRIADGRIQQVTPVHEKFTSFLLPGFIDAHVHIESSMLVPTEFARAAVVHGTVATVSDPHEIGNVLGVEGVRYMLANADESPFKFYFGAPSCVPATTFETAGAEITVAEVAELLDDPRILYLSEMMNFPGVLHGDPAVMAKIEAARERHKPIDGHAPGLRGDDARRYVAAGPSTDHECFTREEALDKLAAGAKIAIREGSAARNFDALYPLIGEYPDATMLCSDDKHPDELLEGHINRLVRRSVERGIDVFHALRAACVNPVRHYGLDVGQLRTGDPADFIEVNSLETFDVLRTWIGGRLVAEAGQSLLTPVRVPVANRFAAAPIQASALRVPAQGTQLRVIEAIDGQLITKCLIAPARIEDGAAVSDPERDILKIVVVNRYADAPPAVAFVRNFGLARGAMASSVAHDSHNVIGVGATDEELAAAVNLVIEQRGGLSAVGNGHREVLPLPVAGLMATGSCQEVGAAYAKLDRLVKMLGSELRAPFMTLSFMALLVIPDLKLSDLGLFDGQRFEFVPLSKAPLPSEEKLGEG
jgi:adenine deaminase